MSEPLKKVLIVDDEPDVRALLTTMVESLGLAAETAKDGSEALEKARRQKPSLILLDVMLPKIDGYKVARILKFDEKYKHIPIIMITAKIREKDKKVGKEMGADAYITKPFNAEEVMAKIKEVLAEKELG